MKEALRMETERMDDLALVLTHMQRMQVAALLNTHVPTHGVRKGRSMASGPRCGRRADHRMNRVQEWANRRRATMQGCGMEAWTPLDRTDDRLADGRRLRSEDERSRACEQEVMEHLVRVSHWDARGVRVETTTVSSDADVSEERWLPWGHANDHRPDLGPWKIALARVDPCGMPLATDVLSGEHADDPVSGPVINRVREGLARTGLLDMGDGNMAAAHTRASVQAQGDWSLCPLSAWHVSAGIAFTLYN